MAEDLGLFIPCEREEFESCMNALRKALKPPHVFLSFEVDRTFGGLRAYFHPSKVNEFLNMRFVHLYPVYRLTTSMILYIDHQPGMNFRKLITSFMSNEIGKEVSVSELQFMGMLNPFVRKYKFELGVPEKYSLPVFKKMGWPNMTLKFPLYGVEFKVSFCCSVCSGNHTTWGCPIGTEAQSNGIAGSASVRATSMVKEISEDPILNFIAEIRTSNQFSNAPIPHKVSRIYKEKNINPYRPPRPSDITNESYRKFGAASTEGIKKRVFHPEPRLLDKGRKPVVCADPKAKSGWTSLIEHPNLKNFFNDCFPERVLKIFYETPGPLDGDKMVIFLSHVKVTDLDQRRSPLQIAACYTDEVDLLKNQLIRIKTLCLKISYLVPEEQRFLKWLKWVLHHYH